MIDLRRDMVTGPSRAMTEATIAAPVGVAVYRDDPNRQKP
ncbi:L-allo-threonine aldolase [Escherichia coli]|nr:L-allo-threonine aldolase [Escherichia coli]